MAWGGDYDYEFEEKRPLRFLDHLNPLNYIHKKNYSPKEETKGLIPNPVDLLANLVYYASKPLEYLTGKITRGIGQIGGLEKEDLD